MFFQFFQRHTLTLSRHSVYHGVAVGTQWDEIMGWVNHVYSLKGVVRVHMVYLDITFSNVAVGFAEVKPATDAVDATAPKVLVVFDALTAQLRVALFLGQVVLMLQSFSIGRIVGIVVCNWWLGVVGNLGGKFLLAWHKNRSGFLLQRFHKQPIPLQHLGITWFFTPVDILQHGMGFDLLAQRLYLVFILKVVDTCVACAKVFV